MLSANRDIRSLGAARHAPTPKSLVLGSRSEPLEPTTVYPEAQCVCKAPDASLRQCSTYMSTVQRRPPGCWFFVWSRNIAFTGFFGVEFFLGSWVGVTTFNDYTVTGCCDIHVGRAIQVDWTVVWTGIHAKAKKTLTLSWTGRTFGIQSASQSLDTKEGQG